MEFRGFLAYLFEILIQLIFITYFLKKKLYNEFFNVFIWIKSFSKGILTYFKPHFKDKLINLR